MQPKLFIALHILTGSNDTISVQGEISQGSVSGFVGIDRGTSRRSTDKRITGRDCNQRMADRDSRTPLPQPEARNPFASNHLEAKISETIDIKATPLAHLQDFRQIPLIRVDLGPSDLHRFGQVGFVELYRDQTVAQARSGRVMGRVYRCRFQRLSWASR